MKNTINYTALALITSMSFACASTIKVVNENKKPLTVKIEAEGDSNAYSKQEISAEQNSTFKVEKSQLNGKSHFSIKGDTSVITPGGKCENLSVEKNYKVTFQDDKMGTTCIAEEIATR
jgi:hypothetical protein